MRINSKAHAGFCGACGPCKCINSRRSSFKEKKEAGRPRVDCWWDKKGPNSKLKRAIKVETNLIEEESETNI